MGGAGLHSRYVRSGSSTFSGGDMSDEQEPVAYLCENAAGHKYFRWKKPPSEYKPIALYTAPPQREWNGLTDEEVIDRANKEVFSEAFARGVLWATEKLKEKNT